MVAGLPGTFQPFFFPLGIAFMGSQSAVMMKMAGEQWQYGKRRIAAMSNEDFNKLTPQKLINIETKELRAMIPTIQQSMKDMSVLTPTIVQEMINMYKAFLYQIYGEIQGTADEALHPFFNFMLESLGLPTKKINVDTINTEDKFQPPVEEPEGLPKTTPEPEGDKFQVGGGTVTVPPGKEKPKPIEGQLRDELIELNKVYAAYTKEIQTQNKKLNTVNNPAKRRSIEAHIFDLRRKRQDVLNKIAEIEKKLLAL